MIIKCPKCGEDILVDGLGRKTTPIPFNNISKALQWHTKGHWEGLPHLTKTAREIFGLFQIKVTAGFVLLRLRNEADRRNMSYLELVAELKGEGK